VNLSSSLVLKEYSWWLVVNKFKEKMDLKMNLLLENWWVCMMKYGALSYQQQACFVLTGYCLLCCLPTMFLTCLHSHYPFRFLPLSSLHSLNNFKYKYTCLKNLFLKHNIKIYRNKIQYFILLIIELLPNY